MPLSKGRASRSESGTWRRGSAEDGREAPSVSEEEEAMAKPRTASVARSTRGRRPKAETLSDDTMFVETLLPATGEPVEHDDVSVPVRLSVVPALSVAGSVLALLCFLGLLTYYTARMRGLINQPSPLSGKVSQPASENLLLWVHNHLQWVQYLLEAETDTKSLEIIQKLEDVGLELEVAELVCAECPVCTNTVVLETKLVPDTEIMQDPVRVVLPSFLSRYPAISYYTQYIFDVSYQAIQDHPWVFMLIVFGAACQTLELLLRLGNAGLTYALNAAQNIDRMYAQNGNHEIVVKLDLNAETERARKKAEEKLLARMRNIEPTD
jgi:hypothetical protein